MDALYGPLQAVESSRSPQPALDRLTAALHNPARPASALRHDLDQAKREIDDLLKGYHKAITKLGSAIDKTVSHHPPSLSPERFTSPADQAALDRAVAHALVRLGQRSTLESFAREAATSTATAVARGEFEPDVPMDDASEPVVRHRPPPPPAPLELPPLLAHVERLEAVVHSLHSGDLGPALEWTTSGLPAGAGTADLRFALHKTAFLTLLAGGEPFPPTAGPAGSGGGGGGGGSSTGQARALAYARAHLTAFYSADTAGEGYVGPVGAGGEPIYRYRTEIHRLLGALVFRPPQSTAAAASASASDGMLLLPYADLHASPASFGPSLEPLVRRVFASAFSLAQTPALDRALRAGLDGGVARVEKARAVLAMGGVGVGAAAEEDGAAGVGGGRGGSGGAGGTTTAPGPTERELPVEIPLEPADRHHSVFVCPVSKELALPSSQSNAPSPPSAAAAAATDLPGSISTGGGTRTAAYPSHFYSLSSSTPPAQPLSTPQTTSPAAGNPAVMLKCGHTVVRESLKRLPKGTSAASRAAAAAGGGVGGRAVKCAYCPMETPAGKELDLHF